VALIQRRREAEVGALAVDPTVDGAAFGLQEETQASAAIKRALDQCVAVVSTVGDAAFGVQDEAHASAAVTREADHPVGR
jgi:hypothetical protein